MVSIKKSWPFFVGLALSFSLLWPLVKAPIFTHHDDIQVIRLHQMDKCFQDGQIPCRWVPDLGGLYGYPLFNYYAPLPYYFGELIYSLTNSLITSVKVMFAVSFLGSYIFMYLLARKFWGEMGGSLSAVFYSFAPYHALDFYVRGAMGEMWGMMFFPALFWAYVRLFEKINIGNVLLCALFIAGLLTAHNLSAMIFLPVLLIWILFFFLRNKLVKFLWSSLMAVILGVFLASFYLFPMLFEKNLVHVDTTTYGYFSYTEHFKGFKKLLMERSWGYGGSFREVPGGEKDGLSYQIGWVHLFGWVLAMFAGFKLWNTNRKISSIIIFISIISLITIFMVNPRSQFIWDLITPLKYLQFPWRFLMLITFLVSLSIGSFTLVKKRKIWWWGLLIAVVFFNFSYFKPEEFLQTTDKELLEGENWERQIKRSIFDYLPIYAIEPPANLAKDRYQILTGDSKVYDYSQGSNWIKFKTQTNTHSIIRVSQYYFPNWRVFVDSKEVKAEYKNNSLGLMTLILGEGNHDIYMRLYDTRIRAISNVLTVVAAGLMLFLFIIQLKKAKRWIAYYRKRVN